MFHSNVFGHPWFYLRSVLLLTLILRFSALIFCWHDITGRSFHRLFHSGFLYRTNMGRSRVNRNLVSIRRDYHILGWIIHWTLQDPLDLVFALMNSNVDFLFQIWIHTVLSIDTNFLLWVFLNPSQSFIPICVGEHPS
jgi:hypothetical protein